MLISENGVIRYHVIAEEWKIFDKMKPPFYSMEQGVTLEILDSLMQIESTLKADTAYYMIDDDNYPYLSIAFLYVYFHWIQ